MTLPNKFNSHYKYLETINIKELGIRKKLDIYIAKDLKNQSCLILHITQKSRFLQKDVDKLEEIKSIVIDNITQHITSIVIYIESPLCSKAKTKMEELQWIVLI